MIKVVVLKPTNSKSFNLNINLNSGDYKVTYVDSVYGLKRNLHRNTDLLFIPSDLRGLRSIPSGIDFPTTSVYIYGDLTSKEFERAYNTNQNVARFA